MKNLAAQYQYGGEEPIINNVVPNVKQQDYLTQDDLVILCYWKSPRIHTRCAQNPADYIEAVTRTALTTTQERLRIEILMLLSGVSWPMASVILHWCHPDPYPILDFRALWSLSIDTLRTYDFNLWWTYTQFCRNLAQQNNVSMRELDQALWQFSKMNQGAART